jgi:hypothetical protein
MSHDMHFDLPPGYLHRLHGSSDSPGNILRRLVLCSRRPSTRDSDLSTFSMKSKPSPTDLTLLMVGLRHVDITWSNLTVASVDYIGVDECFTYVSPPCRYKTEKRSDIMYCCIRGQRTQLMLMV